MFDSLRSKPQKIGIICEDDSPLTQSKFYVSLVWCVEKIGCRGGGYINVSPPQAVSDGMGNMLVKVKPKHFLRSRGSRPMAFQQARSIVDTQVFGKRLVLTHFTENRIAIIE